ncbi:adenylyltransferase/cytidyltransferase family protein [Candidatus Nitrosocosmicus franklandus]|uniref:Glycerol-3-phosphate cytidylyltransferase n=1 Tax=Candidatus Nitrosocosmicus franklandianus TaxID=1798806 RepID=A0A484IC07_9ARCH|nr:adenylyltransferase/cytidyltransferase family protein [Candidatus Nitrosocosmicus franklandus]VFJ15294.1 Glycerol-3-phosphate cytidylyltransferase [Candidatus Nitrosocosmicus franklandus]
MNSTQRYLLSSIYCNNLSLEILQENNDNDSKGNEDSISISTSASPAPATRAEMPFLSYLSRKLEFDSTLFENELLNLEKEKLIEIKKNKQIGRSTINKEDEVFLTKRGRAEIKVVLVGGVFDLLHAGHIHTLKAAKLLGDVLIIVVATDATVSNLRSNRKIFHNENSRLELVSSIRFVDKAIIGRKTSIYDTVSFVRPDIIALGYDQSHDVKSMKKNCLERGIDVEVVRLSSPIPELKSSAIKSELGSSFYDLQ